MEDPSPRLMLLAVALVLAYFLIQNMGAVRCHG